MKKFEFETSKGSFVLADSYVENGIDLKQITEEQASEIVDSIDSQVSFKTSLNILLKSKGVHLFENPYNEEAEQNTFYNPYIFKL